MAWDLGQIHCKLAIGEDRIYGSEHLRAALLKS